MRYFLSASLWLSAIALFAQSIPLPEHPNPIKMRSEWINLNGQWDFQFDSANEGLSAGWSGNPNFSQKITVPFPWGSQLSGLEDEADIGWYSREITVPASWDGKKTFLIIGASDWETHVWLDGQLLGSHQGGYVPFEFDLTPYVTYDQPMQLVIRADDTRRTHTLYGKQGYGNARGIWQTVYLEGRGQTYLEDVHIAPDIDNGRLTVTAYLPTPATEEIEARVLAKSEGQNQVGTLRFKKDQYAATTTIAIPSFKLWTLDDPVLYDATITMGDDELQTYFGMRKISTMNLPGTDIPYIALNNEPIYLQLALDQSYHPEGFYTFPDEQFMIDEIKRSKSIGLNGIRTHIKVEIPRKLYWADKLGLLVMEDLPNSWGEPGERMQQESNYTLREMIKRDFNHPSIFSWVIFNETWGLFSDTEDGRKYLPSTQRWVESMYYLAKSLDSTRLVEDNSICCGRGHTVTDINSWHVYLPGYAWDEHLENISKNSFEGSTFHYEKGYTQGPEPNINSECGNVWGYEGSTGDVDWSWDYHRMINTFRKYPKVGGWLYTEHHDVINEWNGYWRFDRSEKYTGMEEIVPEMTLKDLHSPIYLTTGQEIVYEASAGKELDIPLHLSSMSSAVLEQTISLEYGISSVTTYGETFDYKALGSMPIRYTPWMQKSLRSLRIKAPNHNGLSIVRLILKDGLGEVLHRNFVFLQTTGAPEPGGIQTVSVVPNNFSEAFWSSKSWTVLEGKKMNGAGQGHFEYTFKLPENGSLAAAKEAYFIVEASAKELFVKDMQSYDRDQDFMKGSRVAPSSNPNSYPMTDEETFTSDIVISINGEKVAERSLADDPADHRGALSWMAQAQDRTLKEAGSYGYLIKINIDKAFRDQAEENGVLKVRLATKGEGGMAIYGKDFGRYPFDPSLVILR
ncbi:MAG: sugar-binding domain-containing protein [Bacteroidota bacterium]